MKKGKHGGKREGAGPKFIYGEETCNITLRVPLSKKAEVKEMIYSYLNQFKVVKSDVTSKGGHYGC
jgi:hypothetical protein